MKLLWLLAIGLGLTLPFVLFHPVPTGMPDDLRSAVKNLGMSDPMAQIGTGLMRIGASIQDNVRWAEKKAKPYVDRVKRKATSVGRSLTGRR